MDILRQCVGIDISKDSFTACLCKQNTTGTCQFSKVYKFSNNKTGFNQLLRWVRKVKQTDLSIIYVMEATGVYYEPLAFHLYKLNKKVSVVLPNKVSHYAKSLNSKTKTDEEDAKVISRMGAERSLTEWTTPSPIYKKLRALTRLYKTLKDDKTMTTNRLKQVKCSHEPLSLVVKTHQSTIKRLKKQIANVEAEIEKLLKSDAVLWTKIEKLLTIKGIGFKSIAIVLAETQGFKLIKNQRQLVSYSGLDIISKESGTSLKGKTRISKKGNSHIRAALYFPAMVACRFNPKMKKIYQRIIKNKSSKKIGIIVVQRRLLVLMYSMWKNDMAYVENYDELKTSGFQEESCSSSSSTRRVETSQNEGKVDGATKRPSTQNEHLYDQSSDALLRQQQIS